MRKWLHNKWYTPIVLGGVSLFLMSFSPLDVDSVPSTQKNSSPTHLLTQHDLLEANPIKDEAFKFFIPSWKKEALWPGLIGQVGKAAPLVDPLDTSFSDLDYLLDDPYNRLEPEFRIPVELKERVRFWVQVFGRLTSKTKVIHDKRKPEVIYGYLDFRPLFKDSNSFATASYRAAHAERVALKALVARMKEASGLTKTHFLNDEERADLRDLVESAGGGLDEKAVQRAIRNLRTQTGQNDYFIEGIQRAQVILPQIESIFKEKGLPLGLTRIPFIESSFNPRAYSKIGAIGLWQFIRETAKQMIHHQSEEHWRDPVAQSKAAAKLLKVYRSVLPDWGITITAYNSGVGRMRRLVQKYGVESVADFDSIHIREDFGFAGRNFFVEFLAVNLLEQYKDILFPNLVPPMEPFLVFKGISLQE